MSQLLSVYWKCSFLLKKYTSYPKQFLHIKIDFMQLEWLSCSPNCFLSNLSTFLQPRSHFYKPDSFAVPIALFQSHLLICSANILLLSCSLNRFFAVLFAFSQTKILCCNSNWIFKVPFDYLLYQYFVTILIAFFCTVSCFLVVPIALYQSHLPFCCRNCFLAF